jgi:hypothetical protein
MEVKMVDGGSSSDAVVAKSELIFFWYLAPGSTLKIFNKRRRISEPMICGNSSSGYIDRIE